MYKHPDGERHSSSILTTTVSVITAERAVLESDEARRISPQNGDVSRWLSKLHSSEGICLIDNRGGSGVSTSGSSSVTNPRGNGFVLLTRKNWSRCTSTESVMNAVTGMGKSLFVARDNARARCWPSTIQPGLARSAGGTGISTLPLSAKPSLVLGPRLDMKRTVEDIARMIGLGNSTAGPLR